MTKPRRFLIALDRGHAITTCAVDFGLEQIGQSEFRDKDGAVVRIIDRPDDLRGLRDFEIYLGFEWYRRPDFGTIQAIIDAARARILPTKWSP